MIPDTNCGITGPLTMAVPERNSLADLFFQIKGKSKSRKGLKRSSQPTLKDSTQAVVKKTVPAPHAHGGLDGGRTKEQDGEEADGVKDKKREAKRS